MTTTIPTTINSRWTLLLPEHRAARPEWPTWERERLASMHGWVAGWHGDSPPVIYDIGAEEGDLPALYATWGADVVCFEPNPRVWPNIRVCFEANGHHPAGWFVGFAGDYDDDRGGARAARETLAARREAQSWPPCAYGPVTVDHGFCQLNERPDIPSITVDEFAMNSGLTPDALTIDVEGSELRVLRGARDVLDAHRPAVWVAVHPTFMVEQYGDRPFDLHQFMHDAGYHGTLLADVHEEHWLYVHKGRP